MKSLPPKSLRKSARQRSETKDVDDGERDLSRQTNILLNEQEFASGMEALASTPSEITLGTHNACNAKCIFCLEGKYSRFDLDYYRNFFEANMGRFIRNADSVTFTGFGEVLWVPGIEKFLDYINETLPNTRKIFTTNGTPLKSPIVERLLQGDYILQISLHASNAALHQKLTLLDGQFDSILENIRSLAAARVVRRRAQGASGWNPSIRLFNVLNTINIDDLPDFVQLAYDLGAEQIRCWYMTIFASEHIELSCYFDQERANRSIRKARELADALQRRDPKRPFGFDLPPLFGPHQAPTPARCSDPWKHLYVELQGNVQPCCYWEEHIGNLKEGDRVEELWNGEFYRSLRKGMASGDPLPGCRNCVRFNGYNVNSLLCHVTNRLDVKKSLLQEIDRRGLLKSPSEAIVQLMQAPSIGSDCVGPEKAVPAPIPGPAPSGSSDIPQLNAAKASFRLRHLFNPFYLARRTREIQSARDLIDRGKNIVRYFYGRIEAHYYFIQGVPNLVRSKTERVYFAARGFPHGVFCAAERLYYEIRGWLKRLRAHLTRPRDIQFSEGIQRPASTISALTLSNGSLVVPAGPVVQKTANPCFPARVVSLSTEEFRPSCASALINQKAFDRRRSLSAIFRAATPFKHVVIDGLFDPEFCRSLVREFPPFDAERFRNEHGHLGKAHHENVRQLGPSYEQLDGLLRSSAFMGLISDITGIPNLLFDPEYFGGGAHENLETMELDPHVDFTVHPDSGLFRRVNLLLYLNPEWDASWGGALELHRDPWQPPDKDPIQTILPSFNRCVIFETSDHSWHGFQPIYLPESRKSLSRRSFALYLYTRDEPRDIQSIPSDLTVFVDRPLPELRPGQVLNEQDIRLLSHLIVRRDWKLKYLYDRAIQLYNERQKSKQGLSKRRARKGGPSRGPRRDS